MSHDSPPGTHADGTKSVNGPTSRICQSRVLLSAASVSSRGCKDGTEQNSVAISLELAAYWKEVEGPLIPMVQMMGFWSLFTS